MKLENSEIQSYVEEKYSYLVNKYSKHNILGTFVVGIANYGFAETDDIITTVGIYIPSFEDLCVKVAEDWIENDIHMVDIRRMYNSLDTCKWGALELLYSNHMIINPIYESLFKSNFLDNRDIISKGNKKNRLQICFQRMVNAWAKGNFFEVARLLIATDLYMLGCDCECIFHLEKDYHIKYLEEIKSGEGKIDMGQMKKDIDDFDDKVFYMKNDRNPKADEIIKNGIISIIKANLHNKVSIDAFYAGLTKTEISALKEILNRLDANGTGNISISKIVEETGISRPVFKNLFVKLEKDKVAKINNQGVKGTYIDFDMSLFN